MHKHKILAIQFKYLGDAVFITPALLALKNQYPTAEIHLLVSTEVAQLFKHMPWIDRLWTLPHQRGRINFLASAKNIWQLYNQHFDQSVDFVGNDRGAILSFLINAKDRLAATSDKPRILQRIAYTNKVSADLLPVSWIARHLTMLHQAWDTIIPDQPKMTLYSDSKLVETAKSILQDKTVICHIGTSQPKKEWSIKSWAEFYNLAREAGYKLAFSSGTNDRERLLLTNLQQIEPSIFILPVSANLETFLAILNQAQLVIVGDTGPLHFASALGTKVIGLFGTKDSVSRAAPIYSSNEVLFGHQCTCLNELAKLDTCSNINHCLDSITPQQVLDLLKIRLPITN